MDENAMDGNEVHEVDEQLVPEDTATTRDRTPVPWAAILVLVWAVLLVVFAVQNAHEATVEFLAWDWQMPMALLIMITALVTLVVTGVGFAFYRRRQRKTRRWREASRAKD